MQLRVELNEKKLLLSGPNPLQKLCWIWPGLPRALRSLIWPVVQAARH
jgi:hypothetical protein